MKNFLKFIILIYSFFYIGISWCDSYVSTSWRDSIAPSRDKPGSRGPFDPSTGSGLRAAGRRLNSNSANIVTDDIGVQINIKPAQRIISLAPDITEILFAVGAGESIKGVIQGSDYPAAALNIPQVGSYAGLDMERIIQLKPDLIIAWDRTFIRQIALFKKLGIPVYTTKPVKIEDVAKSMQNFGMLTNHKEQAQKVAGNFLFELQQLKSKYQHKKNLKIYYQIGDYALLTINHQSWINQAIVACGGENIFANAKSITPEITWEELLIRNPQVILSDASQQKIQTHFAKMQLISAVKSQQMYHIPADWIDRAGPRLLKGINTICSSIDQARDVYK